MENQKMELTVTYKLGEEVMEIKSNKFIAFVFETNNMTTINQTSSGIEMLLVDTKVKNLMEKKTESVKNNFEYEIPKITEENPEVLLSSFFKGLMKDLL